MNKMKNLSLMLMAALAVQFAPQKSEAVFMNEVYNVRHSFIWNVYDFPVVGSVLCFFTLPLCVLDEEASNAGALNVNELASNGYTAQEIQLVLKDQAELSKILAAKKMGMKVQSQETADDIKAQIRSLYPEASEVYLDLFVSQQGL